MYSAKVVESEHKDLIHDVAFNWYGTHMATCSSDQTVKVWTQDSETNNWACTASWKCHSGAVWKITWAHPEFGQVLATCSFDRSASVWEEVPGNEQAKSTGVVASSTPASHDADASKRHWVRKASLVDSRTSVTDVKFAPKHLGLMLATCSADGTVRVYEACDVMNLSQWTLQHEIPCKVACSCLSWNPSMISSQPPMLAVGSDDRNPAMGAKVFIYEYNESARRWNKADSLSTITEAVHDIAFAPNIGRSYSVLAVASKDLRVITIKPSGQSFGGDLISTSSQVSLSGAGSTKFDVRLAGQFNDHNALVWRVCWNVTGTILASSGDDGMIRLWKANYLDNWKCVATLKGDGTGVANEGQSKDEKSAAAPGMAFASAGGAKGGVWPAQTWA